jgi:hypothetical protein
MLTDDVARSLGTRFRINYNVVPFNEWKRGLEIELEHGTRFGRITNVTDNNLILTAKIAIAHLIEYPDYYRRLQQLEDEAQKYWAKRPKPKIFN